MNEHKLPDTARVGEKTIQRVASESLTTPSTRRKRSTKNTTSTSSNIEVTYVDPELLREIKATADRIVNDPNNSYTRKRTINSTTVIVT